MLALDVNLLSSKLQKQTLDDGQSVTTNIQLINPEKSYTLSDSAQTKLGAVTTVTNVLHVSLNSDRKLGDVAFSIPQNTAVTKVLCSHKKHRHSCELCENASFTCQISSERPIKRHCRSVCVQQMNINTPQEKSTWQPQGSLLWKPVSMATGKSLMHTMYDGKRDVGWLPNEFQNYENISSLAQSVNCHNETAHHHFETGHITPDRFITSPESPVSRPGSVYSDGAISPFNGDYPYDYAHQVHYFHDFINRSLSVEDGISCYVTNCTGAATNSQGHNNSVPSSPHHRYRVPRCRSQPSFYDRKSRRTRRRDCRPTINFNKMTQTAYGHRRSSDGISIGDDRTKFHMDLDSVTSLMPIASSPHDSDISMTNIFASSNSTASPTHELEATNRDSLTNSVMEEESENSGPVKLLGEDDQSETDMEFFQLTEELDLEQIENH